MERAVLFFDIDGTLLSEITGKIPESAIDALWAAEKAGHLLFINTGRTACSLPPELYSLPFSGFLCGCGTHITCGDQVLLSHPMTSDRGKEIIDKIRSCNLGGIAEGTEDVYFPSFVSRFDKLESTRRYFRERGIGIERFLDSGNIEYDKLLVYSDEQSDLQSFLSFVEKDMEAMDRGGGIYEVIQKDYSKATACSFILEEFGIARDHAYVFGDSSNDLAMFQFAFHSVAMGCHDQVLDPFTEYVTRTVEDNGIEHALRHYGLI